MIKKLIFVLLIFPNLMFGSEKEARKLFIEADILFNEAGCNITEIKKTIAEISYSSMSNKISSIMDNYPYTNSVDGILLISNAIENFQNCWDIYKNLVNPKHLKIITDYPDTEVAYDLISNNNFIYEKDINSVDDSIENLTKIIDNFFLNLDQEIINEIENTNKNEMTVSEMNKLYNQLLGCISPRLGVDYSKKEKVKVNILMNRDRTVRRTEILGKSRLYDDDPTIKLIHEIALNALSHPDCKVLNLPVGKYEIWKEINFTFDFSSLLSG